LLASSSSNPVTDDTHPAQLDLSVVMLLIGTFASADDFDPAAFVASAAFTLVFFDFIGMLRATFLCIDFVFASSSVNLAKIIASRTVIPGARIRVATACFTLSSLILHVRGMLRERLSVRLYRSIAGD
jgi:hypothetical protein